MYKKILVALENSRWDGALLAHIGALAALHRSELLLVHVADGFAARNYELMKLAESQEMKDDRTYLEASAAVLRERGLSAVTHLALGDPATGILKTAADEQCDLIAMTTHGHRLLADIIYGSTINHVRHKAEVPVLLVRGGSAD
ncbi:MAG: universal stress protein [Chthoniobacterales bacterium]